MSLARNPSMPYIAAGRQERPYERMAVQSHVHVPAADVCADCDGRPSFQAPGEVAREPFRISFKAVVILVAAAVFVLSMIYLNAVARRASLYKEGQAIYTEMQAMEKQMVVLKEQLAKAQEPNSLRYQASRLGMINSEGVVPTEIYAPDTRPAQADFSLSAGNVRASME
ncbi:MAG: hypothetical protein IJ664_01505 [Clostridia bacterium]|nr:hypothetical protein [Clostridia bacterium]